MRRRRRLPEGVVLRDVREVFERTVIAMCTEKGLQFTCTHVEIDSVVGSMLEAFADTLEELAGYIEQEDWDALVALATREQTMAQMRRGRR